MAGIDGERTAFDQAAGLFEQQYVHGCYWAAGGVSAQFRSVSSQAPAGSPVPNPATAVSVRFIRHV
jgi:hypothetical protein